MVLMATVILLNITLGIAAVAVIVIAMPVIAMRHPRGRHLPPPATAGAPRREQAPARELAGAR
jgi:hypothetical protein